MRIVHALAAVALAGLTIATPVTAVAQQRIENPEGTWIHASTDTAFPRVIGMAERTSITEFDSDGNDVGVGYSYKDDNGVLVLTVYVYPVIPEFDCKQTYADSKLAIDRYEGSELLSEMTTYEAGDDSDGEAHFGRYYIPAGAMRPGYPEMVSDVFLYCPAGSGYLVKYRASWNGLESTFPDVSAMMRQIGWGESVD